MRHKPSRDGLSSRSSCSLWGLMAQTGTGGRVIKFEDDTKLRAMVSAFCRQTQNLNISQQLE